jgi:hypothetical protein
MRKADEATVEFGKTYYRIGSHLPPRGMYDRKGRREFFAKRHAKLKEVGVHEFRFKTEADAQSRLEELERDGSLEVGQFCVEGCCGMYFGV